MPSSYLWLIPLLPFTGFLINGTVGRKLPRAAVTGIALLFTAIPAVIVAYLWMIMKAAGAPELIQAVSAPWIAITGFQVNFAFTVDHLTLIMLSIITGVGFLIHLYSAGYMAHEEGYWRFFAYLNLFMFFMSVLVLSESFLLLFVGWEGVGLASYLLIGFYFKKDSAANAGKKAFIVNRIGDFGFLLAMFLLVTHFGTLSFTEVFTEITAHPEWHGGFLTAIALLLVVGATGKSAQIPLYVWLPDAMEGPTPVSALIHAATMVTAGIYMVARCHTLFDRSPYALGVVALIGAATALFAACIGMVQQDIKRVLAYSTVSQLGYMFLACGVGAYGAGIFHLMTHAFFKALLFLAAGSVIHALNGEQDMRKMGALRKRIPVTFWTMTMGVFAIAGLPPWAAFFSKDEILYRAFISDNPLGKLLWFVGLVTAGMTSFYMFRLWFKTFFGKSHVEEPAHDHSHDHGHAAHSHGVHESPWIMLFPLVVLAILSVIGGWVGVPAALGGHNEIEHFLEPVFSTGSPVAEIAGSNGLELTLAAVSVLTALLGLFVAYWLYVKNPGSSTAIARKARPVYKLLENKFYIDEIYQAVIVFPLTAGTRVLLSGIVDWGIVDGSGKLAGATTRGLSTLTRRVQSGNIRSYAGWLALGAAAVLAVMIFGHSLFMR
ncbi:NADH-quinone oxidoreductase subunit L [Granulicella arctica]|uniref:NADH-quinone oxidoreductase subunit L n=1 Tax=Granulicella arctica TaxID=940613 RepID=A0A7Y9PHW8_9BACT|nr:NADH-quinone oxidoreductase subunit L [Granulicella arctica]NYF80212.1 NADH-quinone oxidoreductase subunit L [Granulicella arctica]